MSEFLDSLESCYGTRDLYQVLGVNKNATESELRRAYLRLSLKVHPDRVPAQETSEATTKFQVSWLSHIVLVVRFGVLQALGKVYALLTDTDRRAIYDEHGDITEEGTAATGEQDWTQYWRLLFSKINIRDIKAFEESYKGSSEELECIQSVYCETEGNMDAILDGVRYSLCVTTLLYYFPLRYCVPLWMMKQGSVS